MRFRLHVPFFSFFFFVAPTKQTLADWSLSLLTILNPIYNMYNISTMTQRRRTAGLGGSFQSFYVSVTKTRQNSETRVCRAVHHDETQRSLLYFAERLKRTKSSSLVVCVSRPTTFPAILPFATNAGAAAAAAYDDDDDDYGKRGQLLRNAIEILVLPCKEHTTVFKTCQTVFL